MSAKSLRIRLLLVACVILSCVAAVWPPEERIRLGLDLRGGVRLAVQVHSEQAVQDRLERLREALQSWLQEQGIRFESITLSSDEEILIGGMASRDRRALRKYLDRFDGLYALRCQRGHDSDGCRVSMHAEARQQWLREMAERARAVLWRRIDQYGILEPSITLAGGGVFGRPLRILLEIPGEQDLDRILGLISTTGKLDFRLLHPLHGDPFPSSGQAVEALSGAVPAAYEIVPFQDVKAQGPPQFLVLRSASALQGESLTDARPSQDPITGRPEVDFFLTDEGRRLFSRLTAENVGESLAVVLDGEAVSVAGIEEPIHTASVRIRGLFTTEEASDLALLLRSGSLPAPVQVMDKYFIGPSLGSDSIRNGIRASALALLLVAICMLVVYRVEGLISVVCLGINLAVLMGVLATFQGALTLAGIAGIALTMGMAVDAHILIFERIREELAAGNSMQAAVGTGHRLVWRTLLDTNLTTLMAALLLFQFGPGSLRGFAVTLSIGLLSNLFTATFVSRTFFELMLRVRGRGRRGSPRMKAKVSRNPREILFS